MEKFINISNALQVIVSEFSGTLMLELRGQFKPQRLSVGKINFVLAHAAKLHNLAQNGKEGHYTLDKDNSVIMSKFQNVMMYELRGQFKPARISQNKLDAILAHLEELRQIIDENKVEVQEKEIVKAQTALKQNAASMPTDKKSAKESEMGPEPAQESVPVATGYAPGTLTDFVSWFVHEYDATKETARQWIDDKEYQTEFIAYLETRKVTARPQKRVTTPTAPQRPLKRETSLAIAKPEETTGHQISAPVQKAKKGRGVPMSLSVMTKVGKTNFSRVESGIDAIRLLKNKTLIHPQTKEERLIDDRGENNSHWFAKNVLDGFIFDVKRLNA